jgi:hypothetical protein
MDIVDYNKPAASIMGMENRQRFTKQSVGKANNLE